MGPPLLVEAHLNCPEPLPVPVAVSLTFPKVGPILDKTLQEAPPHLYPARRAHTKAPRLTEAQRPRRSLDGPAHLLHLPAFHPGGTGLFHPLLVAPPLVPGQGLPQLLRRCQTAADRHFLPLLQGRPSFPMTAPHRRRFLREVIGRLRAVTPHLLRLLSTPNLHRPHLPLHLGRYLADLHQFHRGGRDPLRYHQFHLGGMTTASLVYHSGTVRSTGEAFLWTDEEIKY